MVTLTRPSRRAKSQRGAHRVLCEQSCGRQHGHNLLCRVHGSECARQRHLPRSDQGGLLDPLKRGSPHRVQTDMTKPQFDLADSHGKADLMGILSPSLRQGLGSDVAQVALFLTSGDLRSLPGSRAQLTV